MDIATRMLLMDGGKFAPSSLFRANEQGVWYDPSDLTTLFQDAAGTIPVTAVEQPVGLMLDKSGRGNPAYQATSANRPTLSARYNLLTYSEDFSNAVWQKSHTSIVANAAIAPDGTSTADKLVEDTINNSHVIGQYPTVNSGSAYTWSVYAKAAERNQIHFQYYDGTTNKYPIFNLTDGAKVFDGGIGTSWSSTYVGNGWWRFSIFVVSAGTSAQCRIYPVSNNSVSYQGDGTSGIYIWGADFRPSNHGTDLPPYQRVTTNTDYDTVGFPPYLAFNGMSSGMATNSIDFSATDKMSVWAGVRKLTTSPGTIAELSATDSGNNGMFSMFCELTTNTYTWRSKGTIRADLEYNGFQCPLSNVVFADGAISSPKIQLRVNGSLLGANTNTQGTGNYGNHPIYIGARSGASIWFNGYIYSLIVRGAQSTDKQVSNAESWINKKIGKVY